MTLGNIIKEYRVKHGLSMEQFAEKANLSKGYVSMLEKNEHPKTKKPIAPSIETIKAISVVIGVPIDDILKLLDDNQEIFLSISEKGSVPRPINHYGGSINEGDMTFDDFTIAMHNESKDLTEEQKEALLNMAKTLRNSNKK